MTVLYNTLHDTSQIHYCGKQNHCSIYKVKFNTIWQEKKQHLFNTSYRFSCKLEFNTNVWDICK